MRTIKPMILRFSRNPLSPLLRGLGRFALGAWLAVGMVLGVVPPGPSDGLAGTLYRCTDHSGASVFTDSPAQLDQCEKLESDTATFPAPGTRHLGSSPPPRRAPAPTLSEHEARTVAPTSVPGQVTVPVQRHGHLLIVSTRINGTRQARLILDTGASHTILSREVANDLGLLIGTESAPVVLKTAGGMVQAELVRVESISVAEAEVQHSLVAVYDMPDAPPGVDGLLGLTFLNKFVVTLDPARGRLHLRQPQK